MFVIADKEEKEEGMKKKGKEKEGRKDLNLIGLWGSYINVPKIKQDWLPCAPLCFGCLARPSPTAYLQPRLALWVCQQWRSLAPRSYSCPWLYLEATDPCNLSTSFVTCIFIFFNFYGGLVSKIWSKTRFHNFFLNIRVLPFFHLTNIYCKLLYARHWVVRIHWWTLTCKLCSSGAENSVEVPMERC